MQNNIIAPDTRNADDQLREYLKRSKRFRFLNKWLLRGAVVLALAILALGCYELLSGLSRQNILIESGLPTDLGTILPQLDSLHISGKNVVTPQWLQSNRLSRLELQDQRLMSLDGIANAPKLKTLTLDLTNSPIEHLSVLDRLRNLQDLTLYVGRSHIRNLGELSRIKRLNTLSVSMGNSTLDFGSLSSITGLQKLTLRLEGSYGQNLAGLSKLTKIQSLLLDLNTSPIKDLSPLAALTNLESLNLQLSSSRIERLESVAALSNLRSLTLNLQSAGGVHALPDVSRLHKLQCLDLNLENTGYKGLPAGIDQLDLENLAVDVADSFIESLPSLRQHAHLRKLTLNLAFSKVGRMPDLPPGLESLTVASDVPETFDLRRVSRLTLLHALDLDIRHFDLNHLPDLSHLRELKALTLHLYWAQLQNLRALPNVTDLTLYIMTSEENTLNLPVETQIVELGRVVQLKGLSDLTLYLEGSTIPRLPDFGESNPLVTLELHLKGSHIHDLSRIENLKSLTGLSLDLEGTNDLQILPEWRQLSSLQYLSMTLRNSVLRNLANLVHAPRLQTLILNLDESHVDSLPDVNDPANTQDVTLDFENVAIKDLNAVNGFAGVKEITVKRTISSLAGLPALVTKLSLGKTSVEDPPDSCRNWPLDSERN